MNINTIVIIIIYPNVDENNGAKYDGFNMYIINVNTIGITNSTLVTILGLAEMFFSSSFNFFLSNNVLSIDENTSTIFPPVYLK